MLWNEKEGDEKKGMKKRGNKRRRRKKEGSKKVGRCDEAGMGERRGTKEEKRTENKEEGE